MKKLLVITVGQAPRDDIMEEMYPYLKNFEVIQKGALDGLTKEYIEENLKGKKDDYLLVSKLTNGDHVKFSEEKIIGRIQKIIDEYDKKVSYILILCTGHFNHKFNSKHEIIYPQNILKAVIKLILGKNHLMVINPSKDQIDQSKLFWSKHLENVDYYASPYKKDVKEFDQAIAYIKEKNPDLILLDCMGYRTKMKEYIKEKTGKSVILSNNLLGKVISELD
ncbi:MAG: AroM family protein [Anaerococcus obesiensis]